MQNLLPSLPHDSPESSSAPLLFPLVSCDSSLPDETQVTLGCLARDFLPRPVTFSWKFKNSSSISSQNIYNFPDVFTGGKYMATSQVLLPSTAILQSTDDYITCHTKHTTGDKEEKVKLQGELREQAPSSWVLPGCLRVPPPS